MASDDLWKTACKQPKVLVTKSIKNISENTLGDKVGRLHLERQDLNKMAVRRVDALREKAPKMNTIELGGSRNGSVKTLGDHADFDYE
jgi:ribosome production factor 2